MMNDLLATRLMIPVVRAGLVGREWLWRRMGELLDQNGRLLLVSAPAGYGKTTLLAAWLRKVDFPVAWYALDESDNDLTRFLSYLSESLKDISGETAERMTALLQTPLVTSPGAVMTVLLNELVSVEQNFIMVLDDYHVLHERSIHEAISFLLDHQPPNMRVVIATRADPPLPIPRLRARGQLVELRESDLRFMPDETAEFLNHVMGLELAPELLSALHIRTEGWAAGLQMAGISLKEHPDARAFIEGFTGSQRYVMDYLLEEVLRLQTQSVQEFLLRTSILERLTAPLCEYLLEGGDEFSGSQTILEQLEHSNLFLLPLDQNREWFRYHRLFSDLLQQRLVKTHPGLEVELHIRASQWYEQHGWPVEAIEHAFSAKDMERALNLVDKNAEAVMKRSETRIILSWGSRLPAEAIQTRPRLSIYYAYAMLVNGYPHQEIEERLQAIEDGSLSSLRALPLRAYFALFQGDYIEGECLALEALENLPEGDDFLRGLAAFVLGNSIIARGDTQSGKAMLERTARLVQRTDNPFISAAVLITLAEIYFKEGLLHKSQKLFQKALECSQDPQGRKIPIAGKSLIRLAEIMRERNQLEQAQAYLDEGIVLSRVFGRVGAIGGDITLAQIYWETGDFDKAQEALGRAREMAAAFDLTIIDDLLVETYQAWLWLARGNLDAARRWLEDRELDRGEEKNLFGKDDEQSFIYQRVHKYEMMVAARILIQLGRAEEVIPRLDALLVSLEASGRGRLALEARMLKALAFQATGNAEQAQAGLAKVLEIASAEEYVRLFVDEGEPMRHLLMGVLPRLKGDIRKYAARLLSIFAGLENLVEEPAKAQPDTVETLVEPLSRREMDILRLLESSLTTNEISDKLMVSVHTVRSHIKSIYGKLGVHNRMAAVSLARDLQIL